MKSFHFFSIIIFSFLILLGNSNIYGQQQDKLKQVFLTKEMEVQFQSFKQLYPKSIIKWDKQIGTPYEIRHFLTQVYSGPIQERAKKFLQENYPLFGMKKDLTDLKFIKSSKAVVKGKTGIDYVKFKQFHDEIPVVGTETILHITETGKVFRVYNKFYPTIKTINKKEISKEAAIKIAKNNLINENLLPISDDAELVIYPKGNIFYIAWQVQVSHWRFFIDSENGKVLFSTKTILYQNTGSGSVYQENSCDTPNRISGNLPNLNNSGFLQGTYFDVQALTGNRAQNNSYTYNYNVSDLRFDQTEIYYQLEKARSYFENLGFQQIPAQTVAYANDPNQSCNAYYNWGGNFLGFGTTSDGGCDGSACNSPGQDGDIIFHEFTHLVIHQSSNIDGTQYWPSSIHEGVADYFSCSFFNDPCSAEPLFSSCNTCLRNVDNEKKLPFDANYNDPHKMGLILSGALWDIRQNLGQNFTDWVAYVALAGLPSNANFSDYAAGVMEAGVAYFGDIDNWLEAFVLLISLEAMRDSFCKHGIDLPYEDFNCPRIPYIRWWEEKDFKGDSHKRVLNSSDHGKCLKLKNNDAMKSIKFYGLPGWKLYIYDNSGCSTGDDWGVLTFPNDQNAVVEVPKIGWRGESECNPPGSYKFHRDNGIVGKVSAIKHTGP